MFAKLMPLFKGAGILFIVVYVTVFIIGGFVGLAQTVNNFSNLQTYNADTVKEAIRPVMVATGGRIFAKESKMIRSVELLKNRAELSRVNPMIFDEAFFLSKQNSIILNIITIGAIFYVLFIFGNWLAGLGKFDPTTDIVIIFLIVVLFMGVSWLYVTLFEPTATGFYPFKGFIDVIVNYKAVFNLDPIYSMMNLNTINTTMNASIDFLKTTTINLTGV